MLTKRTNILFDDKLWLNLLAISKAEKKSVACLVRQAITDKYFSNGKGAEIKEAYEEIISLRDVYPKINYRKLINNGRKF